MYLRKSKYDTIVDNETRAYKRFSLIPIDLLIFVQITVWKTGTGPMPLVSILSQFDRSLEVLSKIRTPISELQLLVVEGGPRNNHQ